MEKQIKENVSQSNSPTVSSGSSCKCPKCKCFSWPVILLLVLAAAAFSGLLGYIYGTRQSSFEKENAEEVSAPSPAVTPQSSTSAEKVVEDPTKDWETYNSANGRYSIKYPPSWTLRDDSYFKQDIAMGMVSVSSLNSEDRTANNRVSISVSKQTLNQGKAVLETWKKTSGGQLTSYLLDGSNGFQLSWTYSDPTPNSSASRIDIRAENAGLLYSIEISVQNNSENKDQDDLVANQILSTFKFLD